MFKEKAVMFLHAETSMHLGSGQSVGAIDLAIQRERHTGFPMGAASGVKGAVRNWFERHAERLGNPEQAGRRVVATFGPEGEGANDHMGAVAFTDARLLLFPVRSMKGVFAWTTCPAVLGRVRRDLKAAGKEVLWGVPKPGENQVLGMPKNENKTDDGRVLLEEYAFTYQQDEDVVELAAWIQGQAWPASSEYMFWHDWLPGHLLVLHDDAFKDFVTHSTEVQARVKLNEQKTTTGKGGNLFYQENLPSDVLLYALVLAQDDLSRTLGGDGSAKDLLNYVKTLSGERLQMGGDESVGKGIVCVNFHG